MVCNQSSTKPRRLPLRTFVSERVILKRSLNSSVELQQDDTVATGYFDLRYFTINCKWNYYKLEEFRKKQQLQTTRSFKVTEEGV